MTSWCTFFSFFSFFLFVKCGTILRYFDFGTSLVTDKWTPIVMRTHTQTRTTSLPPSRVLLLAHTDPPASRGFVRSPPVLLLARADPWPLAASFLLLPSRRPAHTRRSPPAGRLLRHRQSRWEVNTNKKTTTDLYFLKVQYKPTKHKPDFTCLGLTVREADHFLILD